MNGTGRPALSASTRLAAVIGLPVRHSLSPALQNAAFEALGINWAYLAFEVSPANLPAAIRGMAALGFGGLNVTMPHKEAVFEAVDRLDPSSAALRTVNTVVPDGDGLLTGYTTDGAGFVDSLLDAGVDPRGKRVLLLGAGGAARSVADALARSGAGEVVVVNRGAERAARCAELAGGIGRVGSPIDANDAHIIVNATSVGMGNTELPIDPAFLRSAHVVADLVYHPLETALLAAGRSVGATTVDGLGMLVNQAARSIELWTGMRPPTSVMRAAAETELRARR